jgi:hypothetical protein
MMTGFVIGCAADDGPGQLPPPVPGFVADGAPEAVRGEPYRMDAITPVPPAPPNGIDVFLPVTDGPIGRGTCHPALLGDCLSITGNLSLYGPATTAGGVASVVIDVDLNHPTLDLSFQGIVLAAGQAFLSTPFQATVIDPPPGYAIDSSTGTLHRIDLLGQTVTAIGATNIAGPTAIASCGSAVLAQRVVVAGSVGGAPGSALFDVDLNTAQATLIGLVGASITGMACDGPRGTLLGTGPAGSIVDIDIFTGQGTIVGNPGFVSPGAIAYVGTTDTWFLSDVAADTLHELDPVGLTTTLVGPLPAGGVEGLASHGTDVLYGLSQGTSEVVTVDTQAAGTTPRFALPSADFTGLTF